MKVLDLRCAQGHGFEGWFASDEDFGLQNGRGQVECPLCADKGITRLPSAPRLNLSGARAPGDGPTPERSDPPQAVAAGMQAAWMRAVQHVLRHTEDVGERFPEEARRIHYGEAEHRGIRGQADAEERAALADEGIEVLAIPLPPALKGPAH